MNSDHVRRLRKEYLRRHHTRAYAELKDDGALEAHLRHMQNRARAYYEALIAAGSCHETAEAKVYREVIAPR